jgi:hypothetical protein
MKFAPGFAGITTLSHTDLILLFFLEISIPLGPEIGGGGI